MMLARMMLVVMAVCTGSGCALMRGTCAETAAVRASAAVLCGDAQARLDEAARVIDALPMDVRADAIDALRVAARALDAARGSLSAVDDACAAVDIDGVFAAFRDAWYALVPFIALMGGGHGGGSTVAFPLVVAR